MKHVKMSWVSCVLVLGLGMGLSLRAEQASPAVSMNMDVIETTVCEGDVAEVLLITRMINGGPGVQLRNVQVFSSSCDQIVHFGGDRNGNGALDFGEEFTNVCRVALASTTVISASDTADAFFQGQFLGSVSNRDAAVVTVVHPSFDVQVSPASATVNAGDDLDIVVSVLNNGDVTLDNITIDHAVGTGCDLVVPSLAVGQSFRATCTVAYVSSSFTNDISVTASSLPGCNLSTNLNVEVKVPGCIGDLVWFDADLDGRFNNNELGVPGVLVQLLRGTNVLDSMLTDTNGPYLFKVEPGISSQVCAPTGT